MVECILMTKPLDKLYWDQDTHGLRSEPTRHGWHIELYRVMDVDLKLAQLRGNLSLAEEGLANAMQEIERRDQQLKEATDHEVAYMAEIERLRKLLGSSLTYIRSGKEKIDPYALTLGIEDALGIEAGEDPAVESVSNHGVTIVLCPSCCDRISRAQRALQPSEAASFHKTLARSPRRVEPSVRHSTPDHRPILVHCPDCGRDHPECGKPRTQACYYDAN